VRLDKQQQLWRNNDGHQRTTVAPSWRAGDTIPLGRRTLRVIEVRDGEPDRTRVLVVEDM
jgi:hypothetical protein